MLARQVEGWVPPGGLARAGVAELPPVTTPAGRPLQRSGPACALRQGVLLEQATLGAGVHAHKWGRTLRMQPCSRRTHCDAALPHSHLPPGRALPATPIVYNSVLAACEAACQLEPALDVLDEMRVAGVPRDQYTYSTLISCCYRVRARHAARCPPAQLRPACPIGPHLPARWQPPAPARARSGVCRRLAPRHCQPAARPAEPHRATQRAQRQPTSPCIHAACRWGGSWTRRCACLQRCRRRGWCPTQVGGEGSGWRWSWEAGRESATCAGSSRGISRRARRSSRWKGLAPPLQASAARPAPSPGTLSPCCRSGGQRAAERVRSCGRCRCRGRGLQVGWSCTRGAALGAQ